jgi:hypothetical protein
MRNCNIILFCCIYLIGIKKSSKEVIDLDSVDKGNTSLYDLMHFSTGGKLTKQEEEKRKVSFKIAL